MIRQTSSKKPMPDDCRPQRAPVDPRGNHTGDPNFQVVGIFDNGGHWDSDAGEQDSRFFDPTFGR